MNIHLKLFLNQYIGLVGEVICSKLSMLIFPRVAHIMIAYNAKLLTTINRFSAELFKVDSSMLQIGRLHVYCYYTFGLF